MRKTFGKNRKSGSRNVSVRVDERPIGIMDVRGKNHRSGFIKVYIFTFT